MTESEARLAGLKAGYAHATTFGRTAWIASDAEAANAAYHAAKGESPLTQTTPPVNHLTRPNHRKGKTRD